MLGLAVGVSSAVIFTALFAFATCYVVAGVTAAITAVVLLAGGLAWLECERRRVRRVEVQYLQTHPADSGRPARSTNIAGVLATKYGV